MTLATFLVAAAAGILIGLPTGPARFFVIDTRLNEGKGAALKIYTGFLAASIFYAILALVADDFLSRNKQVEIISHVVASVLLVFWGILIIFKSGKPKNSSSGFDFESPLKKGLAVGLSNPVTPFIYLAFIQAIEIFSVKATLTDKIILLLTFECFSFITTWSIAVIVAKNKTSLLSNWRILKIIMGFFLICMGSFAVYQRVEIRNGISLKQDESFIESQLQKTRN